MVITPCLAVRLPVPGHAQAVAAVEVVVGRLDGLVGRRVADALVQRQDEEGSPFR